MTQGQYQSEFVNMHNKVTKNQKKELGKSITEKMQSVDNDGLKDCDLVRLPEWHR